MTRGFSEEYSRNESHNFHKLAGSVLACPYAEPRSRPLKIERNAQAKLTSVKGLGRSYSWDSYVRQRIELPLFDWRGTAPLTGQVHRPKD
jgi:hypothetical protein